MYRLITESLLGLHLEVDCLRFAPCLPKEWPGFKIHYRYRETLYHIEVRNGGRGTIASRVIADGQEMSDGVIHLVDDRQAHHIEVDVT
jgi:cellobiose phosphorylase